MMNLKTRLVSLFWGEAAGHTIILSFCLGLCLLGLLMSPPKAGSDRVTMSGMNLPTVCSMRRNMGIPCPGCGLTRAFVTAIRGDFKASADYHRMGPFIFFYVVAQGLCQLFWFAIPPKRQTINKIAVFLNWMLIPIGTVMGIDWLRRFF